MQQILCVAFSTSREWDQQNVIITGSTDGTVRMWSIEYVQVPIVQNDEHSKSGELSPTKSDDDNSNEISTIKSTSFDEKNTMNTSAVELIKQMSLTTQEDHHCEHAFEFPTNGDTQLININIKLCLFY